jgi:hypothetical protein
MSDWRLITETDATNVASIEFTGIFTGYKIFKFVVINYRHYHPSSAYGIEFQVNASGQSGYNETITSAAFLATHYESGSGGALNYWGVGLAQGTSFQDISGYVDHEADASGCGELVIYNPQSTTYVKHFMSTFNAGFDSDGTNNGRVGGYVNTTSALSDIKFQQVNGTYNMDGHIKVYGLVAT